MPAAGRITRSASARVPSSTKSKASKYGRMLLGSPPSAARFPHAAMALPRPIMGAVYHPPFIAVRAAPGLRPGRRAVSPQAGPRYARHGGDETTKPLGMISILLIIIHL